MSRSSSNDRKVCIYRGYSNNAILIIGRYSDDSKYKDVFFAKIDVEQLSDLSDKLEVFSMPTLILFKDGIKVETVVDPNGPALQAFLESSLV